MSEDAPEIKSELVPQYPVSLQKDGESVPLQIDVGYNVPVIVDIPTFTRQPAPGELLTFTVPDPDNKGIFRAYNYIATEIAPNKESKLPEIRLEEVSEAEAQRLVEEEIKKRVDLTTLMDTKTLEKVRYYVTGEVHPNNHRQESKPDSMTLSAEGTGQAPITSSDKRKTFPKNAVPTYQVQSTKEDRKRATRQGRHRRGVNYVKDMTPA